jgi:kumamolisin
VATSNKYSKYFIKPDFQTNNPNSMRGIPDVVLNGDPQTGQLYLYNGKYCIVGGTSISTPMYASYLILIQANQFILPELYKNQNKFRKIKEGNNGYYSVNASNNYNVIVGLGIPLHI